jgi:NAD(P)-dependent dehydrogenase (short-subunit alcohol dehydrogenase family)
MKIQRLALVTALGLILTRTRRREMEFKDKVFLITGGSRGLGLALARELFRQGARLALCARSSEELARVQVEFAAQGTAEGRVRTYVCDVANREQVKGLLNQIRSQFGRLDVLINNAGVIGVGPYDVMNEGDFRDTMEINFWGVLNAIQESVPVMLDMPGSDKSIVNITSIGGVVAVPHLLPYTCAKFAAVGLSEGLTTELASRGIRVLTVVPGLMRTGSFLQAGFKGKQKSEFGWFSLSSSLPGVAMNAERAAKKILFALKRRDSHLVLGTPAKMIRLFHDLFPRIFSGALTWVNRALPGNPSDLGAARRRKAEPGYRQREAPSKLTHFGDEAAKKFRETG